MTDQIHDTVRARYAEAATAVDDAASDRALPVRDCCGPDLVAGGTITPAAAAFADRGDGDEVRFGPGLYDAGQRDALPQAAVLASLGCGNPTVVADLREGEVVLDLGSGGGIDVLLSARRVGPTGRAIGIDMTDEMLALARRNAAEAGATNVEFVKGTIEAMPLAAESIDVIISNCVINLAADKPAVFREMARVLRPGGRIGVSDIVAADELSAEERLERGAWADCVAGALSFAEYEADLRAAGLTDIRIVPMHETADRMYAANIQASKPAG